MHWGMNGNKLFSSTDYSATSSQSHTGSHSLNSCPWMLLVYNWKECLAKMNILTLFIHPHVVPCAVICFVEHKRTNFCWELLFNKQTNKFNWVCIESFCFMASQNKQWTGWAESYLLHTLISGFMWLLSLSCFIFWMNKEQMIHSWQYNHKTWWPPITFADKAISTGQGQWWLRVLLSHFRYIWTLLSWVNQWNLLIRARWDLGYGNFLYNRRRIWWEIITFEQSS